MEMAPSLVLHGKGGEIAIREVAIAGSSSLELLTLDRGPEMRNIADCVRDGFPIAGTGATDFGSIKPLSDPFEVFSQPEHGIVIWLPSLSYGYAATVPLLRRSQTATVLQAVFLPEVQSSHAIS
jgi:hypothetical protein